MSSNDRSELLDLQRGLPTTEKDVAASRVLRYPSMTGTEYARFLVSLAPSNPAVLAAKRGPRGEPFRLPKP
jgi:hypothetical protein